jgi:hypothetical protein
VLKSFVNHPVRLLDHRALSSVLTILGGAMSEIHASQQEHPAVQSSTREVGTRIRQARRSRRALGAAAIGALALGATAIGALAIGRLAIGRLAIGGLALKRGRVRSLAVDTLDVRRLHIRELTVDRGLPR